MEFFEKKKRLKKWGLMAGFVVSCLLIFLGSKLFSPPENSSLALFETTSSSSAELLQSSKSSAETIYVDLKGAVINPGVYEVKKDCRLFEVLTQAGGLAPEADEKQINQAEILQDQRVIYIPKKGEVLSQQLEANVVESESSKEEKAQVNLNTADLTLLQTLPGIGAKKAQAILDYRKTQGSFQTIEELMEISGIGVATFEKLKELIVV